jgi:translation initiation factor 2B subunit (eIF-2B alpha/beta/delta family)
VAGILREASHQGKAIRAIATESRPFCEGRELARNLGQQGIPTQVVLDAAVAQYVKRADLVIVGVDRITEESFLNKVGTLSLAMAAREEQVPFYVACETNKFLPTTVAPMRAVLENSEQRAQEEWMNVELVYSLFEQIPNRWLTGIITEEGILSMNALARYFRTFRTSPEISIRAIAG